MKKFKIIKKIPNYNIKIGTIIEERKYPFIKDTIYFYNFFTIRESYIKDHPRYFKSIK